MTETPPPYDAPRPQPVLPTDTIRHSGGLTHARIAAPMVIGIALLAAILGGGIGAAIGIHSHNGTTTAATDGPIVRLGFAHADAQVERRPHSVAAVAARVLPSVVEIKVRSSGEGDTGSGFVIERDGTNGYVLTNNHVISLAATQGGTVSVTFNDGKSATAQIIGRAPTSDLAVLRVTRVSGLRPIALGDSTSIAVGDPVIAIGSPLGLSGTVTEGIVSALHRPVAARGQGTDTDAVIDAIQTDAAVNPGNSGGPLVDVAGRVIGVTSALETLTSNGSFGNTGEAGNIGLGFAIPVNSARLAASQIINRPDHTAQRPIMGVSLDLTYEGSPSGGLVGCPPPPNQVPKCTPVRHNGPAARAGLRAGDVIVDVAGHRTFTANEVIIATRRYRPGATIPVTFVRNGNRHTVHVRLAAAAA
jgi:putative serine protease PepD